MFFSYPSKDIKTKYSYEHVHRVLIKDRINKNASFSQSRPAQQSFSFDHTVPGSVPLPSDIQIFLPNYLRWAICTSSQATMRTRSSNRNLLQSQTPVPHTSLCSQTQQHAPSVTRFSRFHVHRHVSHVKHPELCLSFSLLLQSAAENVQPSFIHAAQALRVCS